MTRVFTFGSNLAGRHGAGSALHALKYHGAVMGEGVGRHGNSYAIPTKDAKLNVLSLAVIAPFVAEFLNYAREHSECRFDVVAIGCGLAGYYPHQIAPMFRDAPENVKLPVEFLDELERTERQRND